MTPKTLGHVVALTAPYKGFIAVVTRYPRTGRKLPAPRILLDATTGLPFADRVAALDALGTWQHATKADFRRLKQVLPATTPEPPAPGPRKSAAELLRNDALSYEREHIRPARSPRPKTKTRVRPEVTKLMDPAGPTPITRPEDPYAGFPIKKCIPGARQWDSKW